jgi:5-methylcytosine-specific restriction endonuclease McrA
MLSTMVFAQDTPYFMVTVSEEHLKKEKEKARELRRSQWWQRRIGRGRCHYCEKSFSPKELTMDHLVPLIRGGRSTRGNIVPACKDCNNRKKYLLPVEWEDYLNKLRGPESPAGDKGTAGSKAQGRDDGRV